MNRFYLAVLAILLVLAMQPNVWAWMIERPSNTMTFVDRSVHNATANDEVEVGIGAHIHEYKENHPEDGDCMDIRIATTADSRRGLDYGVYDSGYSWVDIGEPDGDITYNGYAEIGLMPYQIRFYGGEYGSIFVSCMFGCLWVPSNETMREEIDSSGFWPSPYGESIPSTDGLNSFIAPFWRFLNPYARGQVIYGTRFIRPPGGGANCYCLIISWIGVPDENDNDQTFQVVIDLFPQESHMQSKIWFQYQSVTTDVQTTVGIEDQGGWKGQAYDYTQIHNSDTLRFTQNTNTYYLSELAMYVDQSDSYSSAQLLEHDPWIRGYGVELNQDLEDSELRYATALGNTFTLLLAAYDLIRPGTYAAGVGFLIDGALIMLELAEMCAQAQREARLLDIADDFSWAKAKALETTPYPATVQDSSFCMRAKWSFDDHASNDRDHWLRITVILTYFEVDPTDGEILGYHDIPASVELKVLKDTGNTMVDPNVRTLLPGTHLAFVGENIPPPGFDDEEDYYKFNVDVGMLLHITMSPPENTDFDLYLYDPNGQPADSSERGTGEAEEIYYPTTMGGDWFIRVNAIDGYGIYTLTVDEPYTANALVALKTETDGDFYVPDPTYVETHALKIEFLFSISGQEGDQKGETSPYPNIPNYPDTIVDMRDISFVARKFGLHESSQGWDYMADIIPDRTIDMRDVGRAAGNFGFHGPDYISDLEWVTVEFDTGEVEIPTGLGYVTIPQNAETFIVKNDSSRIGAMVVFW